VTVTSIKDGVVSYEITMTVSSSEVAEATVTAIESSLADQTTLQAIETNVVASATESSNPSLMNSMSEVTVVSNTLVSTTSEIPLVNNALSGVTVLSNTAGISTITEPTVSKVTFDQLTMEIISINGTSVTHDLLNQGKGQQSFETILDSTGMIVALTINEPISSFSPLDEGQLANTIEICSIMPLVPSQLTRPVVEESSTSSVTESEILRPDARRSRLLTSPQEPQSDESYPDSTQQRDDESQHEAADDALLDSHDSFSKRPQYSTLRGLQQQQEAADFCLLLSPGGADLSSAGQPTE